MSSQEAKIIGRGTWLDRVASEVMEREDALGRSTALLRVESGLGASGIPHIGSVGDAIRSYGVKMALESLGYKSELIAFSDDLDGLQEGPRGVPRLGSTTTSRTRSPGYPTPSAATSRSASTWGASSARPLDELGIHYTFKSGAEVYKRACSTTRSRRYSTTRSWSAARSRSSRDRRSTRQVLPYTPICQNCGRLYTTVGHRDTTRSPRRSTTSATAPRSGTQDRQGLRLRGREERHRGRGQAVWKSEFAARWAALDIRFEAYGKDIADSVKVNDWICEHVLAHPPPYHARYEMFQDKSGRKMSKSVGNVITLQDWLTYASPESLRLLMFKRIVGARSISVEDVPVYMDEFDELEDYYFSEKKDPNAMKEARLRGLYEYTMLLRVPARPSLHVPYRLLAELSEAAPEGSIEDYVVRRLGAYGMLKDAPPPELLTRVRWAAAWARREGAKASKSEIPELSEKQLKAVSEFASAIRAAKTADEVQGAAFNAIRSNGIQPGEFFPAVYGLLIGAERGPRLGPYVMDAGPEAVAAKLEKLAQFRWKT